MSVQRVLYFLTELQYLLKSQPYIKLLIAYVQNNQAKICTHDWV